MSKIALKSAEAGTATFTIEAPATNTDRIFELPDEAGKVLTDVSDIEPQVKTATNASGDAPVYACRAWVNFNGRGTVLILASGNVSSITNNGTGDYTVNFTTAMPDANYSVSGFTCRSGTPTVRGGATITYDIQEDGTGTAPTASSLRIRTITNASPNANALVADMALVSISIFR